MNRSIYFRGQLYTVEATAPTAQQSQLNVSALSQAMTNVATLAQYTVPQSSSDYMDKKESLKLVGAQLNKMDLWNPVLEYFDQYLVDISSRQTHAHLMDQQRKLVKLMASVATGVANKYRIAKDKDATTDYRTTDDFQFRKVITIFRHYLYFVALYNLQFIEYINDKVKSSEIFNEEFVKNLPKLYDPPKIKYIDTGYLNPNTNSSFNSSEINSAEWDDELNEKAEQLSSGFSKNAGAWDFRKLMELYTVGLKVDGGGMVEDYYIPVGLGSSEIGDIEEIVDNIHYFIISNLIKLGPNLIRHSMKGAKKTSAEIGIGAVDVKNKSNEIIQPYQTTSDYSKMANNFKGTKPEDSDIKTVANATEYDRRKNNILSKIKDRISKNK